MEKLLSEMMEIKNIRALLLTAARYMVLTAVCILSFPGVYAKRDVSGGDGTLPADYAGSMKTYDFSDVQLSPVWPDSLRPVYLAHVARHGARYISSPKKLDSLRKAISESRAAGSLTKTGRLFEALLDSVASVSEGRWGALSEEGCLEERRIARNLHALMPELLKDAKINAISSYVPRVAMTMYEFCHQLAWISSDVRISTSEGKEFDPLLRCFEADPEYDEYRSHGEWKHLHDSIVDATVPTRPALGIFGGKPGFSEKRLRKLTMDVYDILQSLAAFGMAPADTRFMTAPEYRACWEADNLEHYLRNAITPYTDMAGRATAPLLSKIIMDADAAIDAARFDASLKVADMYSVEVREDYCSANLYFGHAETLMPLLSLMGVEGCTYDSTNLSALAENWRDYDIVPLGAHLDIIILAGPKGELMTALQLNGRFLPPLPGSPLLVSWPAFRAHLISRIGFIR